MQSPLEAPVQALFTTRFLEEGCAMDRDKHSISPRDLYARLGFDVAVIVVDVRRAADFAHADRVVAPAIHCSPDEVEQWGLKVSLRSALMCGRTGILWAFLVVGCIICPKSGGSAQATSIDIGKNEVGTRPADFDLFPSGATQDQWTVVRDATATAGSAIEHSGMIASEDASPLAIYRPVLLKNEDISLRFKAVSGKANRGGGVALRVMASDTYYLVEADARQDRILFLRTFNGESEEIAGVDADIADNNWHTLAIRAENDQFTVSLDGVWVVTAYDKILSSPGRTALWTNSDSVTRFDSITITPLPAAEERY